MHTHATLYVLTYNDLLYTLHSLPRVKQHSMRKSSNIARMKSIVIIYIPKKDESVFREIFGDLRKIPENFGKSRKFPEILGNSPENPAGKFGVFSDFQAVIAYKRL